MNFARPATLDDYLPQDQRAEEWQRLEEEPETLISSSLPITEVKTLYIFIFVTHSYFPCSILKRKKEKKFEKSINIYGF